MVHPHPLTPATDGITTSQGPSSVVVREVTFLSAGHTLAGTLTLPVGDGPWPAAVLISGSGPIDRDSNHRKMRFGISSGLATVLATAGVASLRFDKRGVGASPGDWREAGLFDNVQDVTAAFGHLVADPALDPTRVVLIGHSEGAILALAAAARGVPAAGVVLLAAPARPGREVLVWQLGQVLATMPRLSRTLAILHIDPVKKVRKTHERILASTTDTARINGAKINARWFREFMGHHPAEDLPALTCPVLAITGSKDLQVPVEDLSTIAELAGGGADTHAVANLTHTLRLQPGPAKLRAYRHEIRGPIAPIVTDTITAWVTKTVTPEAAKP